MFLKYSLLWVYHILTPIIFFLLFYIFFFNLEKMIFLLRYSNFISDFVTHKHTYIHTYTHTHKKHKSEFPLTWFFWGNWHLIHYASFYFFSEPFHVNSLEQKTCFSRHFMNLLLWYHQITIYCIPNRTTWITFLCYTLFTTFT